MAAGKQVGHMCLVFQIKRLYHRHRGLWPSNRELLETLDKVLYKNEDVNDECGCNDDCAYCYRKACPCSTHHRGFSR